ncbi:MAG: trypsin-like peptidase domain-containing protein [Chloroflexi bacterium]|jgi:V8-like Glu-specific endopeptidase|nr:trypsin-like peptidase domain-containing protein [Chloroflexota bacterium]MBT3668848.1 trypsin-like peptidase domain-containing protein [Chloroflexota bacterium]MBT4306562.1 trypsin-like peptidase domain-containing protein [Chloroflexota bacterium]MBT4533946.1 trypsin-like peptidase domain-containing protein [Chloroflexota bacterium]MBT4681451.1 trypsin-like peptidase domain-containing protein [Chloroflexota bacterium]
MNWKISKSNLHTTTTGRPINKAFKNKDGQTGDGLSCLISIVQRNEAPNIWNSMGTGFLISNFGLIATAKHVVWDSKKNQVFQNLIGFQLLQAHDHVIIWDIVNISVHEFSDVAVGFIYRSDLSDFSESLRKINQFSLSEFLPDPGSKIAGVALNPNLPRHTQEGFELSLEYQETAGVVEECFPNGRDRVLLPGKCFSTTMGTLPGASGGPVASRDGKVFGINSTGWHGENYSFVSSIQDIFDLEVNNIRKNDSQIHNGVPLSEFISEGKIVVS